MRRSGFPLHVYLSTLFLATSLSIGGIIAFIGYRLSQDLLENSAQELTVRTGREVAADLQKLLAPARLLIDILGQSALVQAQDLESRRGQLPPLAAALRASPQLASVYLGYPNGDFLLLRPLHDGRQRRYFEAPPGSRYLLQNIARATQEGRYLYLDRQLQLLRDDAQDGYAQRFDPRTRPWYQAAQQSDRIITTEPYVFFADHQVGITLARRMPSGTVIAADIALQTLDDALARQAITPSTQLALVDAQGRVIAHPGGGQERSSDAGTPHLANLLELDSPILRLAAGELAALGQASNDQVLRLDGEDWRLQLQPLAQNDAAPLFLLLAIPERELFAAALQLRDTALLVTLVMLALAIPLVWLIARAISRSLRQLAREAEAIQRFDFVTPMQVRSRISEVADLAQAMQLSRETIRRFLDISRAVAEERDFEHLLATLLEETLNAARACSGLLYLQDDDRLQPMAAHDLQGQHDVADLPLRRLSSLPSTLHDALRRHHCQVFVADDELRDALGMPPERFGAAPYCILVPLESRQGELLGLMLLNREALVDPAELAFIGALSGNAARSLETRGLIRAQRQLFDAFVRLIADAIDAKSPYTGGHCQRVPELTKMLAQAACAQRSGPYASFQLDADEWEAVHVAAWLHDCGKITTPEYVIDKATKLETRYNRIHEIRTRFEVLKRDARIAELEARLAGTAEAEAAAQRDARQRQLDEDFAFVAACNIGGEFLASEDLERLQRIAAQPWWRTLDDRLGLSWEEQQRCVGEPSPLPVQEHLLSDRPEQRISRPANRIPAGAASEFNMPLPTLQQNQGELYNLAISRGTLNAEERYIINEHIVQTIVMLDQLPYPRHLRQVPELAGGHHEKMDGTGYPRGLVREQMSPVARMMAIADIFEALTAADRPYKRAKPLSEALAIMREMAQSGHIDVELFELFVESGVHLQYAERFLKPEQIDQP